MLRTSLVSVFAVLILMMVPFTLSGTDPAVEATDGISVAPVAVAVAGFIGDDAGIGRSSDECSYNEEIPLVEDYMSVVSIADPYKGDLDASVTVIEFFDPNCPHCATFHPVMKQVIADNSNHARFFMIPFPLWQYSLLQTEALYVAAQGGKYFEMLDAQYAHQKQGGMSVEEILVLASDIGLDPEVFRTRLEQGLNQRMILERRKEIAEMGVRGTPSVMINGRFVASDSKSRICLNEMIAAEVHAMGASSGD